MVGLAVFCRHHADDLITFHFSLEGTADTAVGAGCIDAAIRNAVRDHALFHQCCRGAGLDAGTAGHTF